MFYNLFDSDAEPYQALKELETRYLLFMEPDLNPVRAHWLHRVWRESMEAAPFWIKGSAVRVPVSESFVVDQFDMRAHINGNSLYAVGDAGFRAFVLRVRDAYFRGAFTRATAFDHVLHRYRTDIVYMPWLEQIATLHL